MATSLALVANELLQNALEHGLAHQDKGRITVSLQQTARKLKLQVYDNGRGLPPQFNPKTDLGLGLNIVRATITEDLQGDFYIGLRKNAPGTEIQVTLPLL
jgi:two-component sensor histidine kinase